jgi:uroporphyrinogen decarboxylase
MTSRERVIAACEFRRPDRIPRMDKFWEFPDAWRERFPSERSLTDISICIIDDTILPTAAGHIRDEGDWSYVRNGWGQLVRSRKGAYFAETIDVAIPLGTDPDSVVFDPVDLDKRFDPLEPDTLENTDGEAAADVTADADQCVFTKSGGPFLRSTFVRGETQFLEDIATDPVLAKVIADRIADHMTSVGVGALLRGRNRLSGVWIYDDMAYNDGPLFSPASFERIFLPAYRRMIRAYKAAGARYVFLHSDGNVRPILDMLVDAGIDGLHPLERRAGMDPWQLRERYPRLILAGGVDNTDVLVNGPVQRVRDETRRLVKFGQDGGYIIGPHSISPEVPLEHYIAYDEVCREEIVTS